MFSLARLFSYTRLLESECNRLRERVRQLESDQHRFVDALARYSNKPLVFDRPDPVPASNVSPVAFGPTMSAQRQAEKEQEIIERAEKARGNGSQVSIPTIPNK